MRVNIMHWESRYIYVHMVEEEKKINFAYHLEQMEARNVHATKMAEYLDNENIVLKGEQIG